MDFMLAMALVVVQGGSCADWYENEVFVRTFSGIQHVPDDIPPRAREVYLGGNSIVTVQTYSFFPLYQCKKLDLSSNGLAVIEPAAFYGMSSLEKLALENNQLEDLEVDMWMGLVNLKGLYLKGNDLKEVRKNMFGKRLQSLEELDISDNHIAALASEAFTPLRNLSVLLLRGNELTHIREESLVLPRMLHVDVSDNPLLCTTDTMCWVPQAVEKGQLQFLEGGTPTCSNLPGTDWMNVAHVLCELDALVTVVSESVEWPTS